MDKLIKQLFSYFFNLKMRVILNKKINSILKNVKFDSSALPKSVLNNNLLLWKKIDGNHNSKWIKVYTAINGVVDERYISEQAYYNVVEPTLNNGSFSEAYSDKNVYSKFIGSSILPKIILRRIEGVLYDENYKLLSNKEEIFENLKVNYNKLVCKKAVETAGGKGITIFNLYNNKWINENDKELSFQYLNRLLGSNYVIQEYIIQHPFFHQFNSSSVNTIRIFTYRSVINNEIRLLHSVFRIGKAGAFVDNQASGGISCGVDMESGKLNDFAINKYGIKSFESNNVTFSKNIVPKFELIKKIAKDVSILFPYHRLLGFDFSLDKNSEVKLIEVNVKNNEINFFQMNTGSLFHDYTDEIVKFCMNNKKVLNIDFEI